MADPAQQPAERKLLGMPLGEWTKAIVGVVLGASLTAFGFWLSSSKPHLTVKVSNTAKFQGEKHNTGFTNVNVMNDGSKEAEAVECQFAFYAVQEVKVSPDNLNAVTSAKDGKVVVNVPLLNPGESITIAAYTNNINGVPDTVPVTVRGKGVVGEPHAPKPYSWLSSLIPATIGAIFTIIIIFASEKIYYKQGFQAGKEAGKNEIESQFQAAIDAAKASLAEREKKSLPDKNTDNSPPS